MWGAGASVYMCLSAEIWCPASFVFTASQLFAFEWPGQLSFSHVTRSLISLLYSRLAGIFRKDFNDVKEN